MVVSFTGGINVVGGWRGVCGRKPSTWPKLYNIMSDCWLTPNMQFFSYITERTSNITMRWRGPLWFQQTRPLCWNHSDTWLKISPRVDMSIHYDTLSPFRANKSSQLLFKGIQSFRLIFFFYIKSCQYSMFYTNCSWNFA